MLKSLAYAAAAAALLAGPALAQATTTTAQPATPATAAQPATPAGATGQPATPATPAQPATPAGDAAQPPASGDATAAAPAAGQVFANTQQTGTIFAALQGNPQFSALVTALETTNLDDVLNGTDRQYTLFAPTNAALAAVPEAQRNNPQALQRLLLHHVVGTQVSAAQLRNERQNNRPLPMADNVPQAISGTGDTVQIGGATVVQSDVRASNGTIHVIDGVIGADAGTSAAAAGAAPAAPASAGGATTTGTAPAAPSGSASPSTTSGGR